MAKEDGKPGAQLAGLFGARHDPAAPTPFGRIFVPNAAWLAKAGPLGAEVDVKLGEGLVRGRFAGLDREGALLLDTATGPRKIVSGELLGRAA